MSDENASHVFLPSPNPRIKTCVRCGRLESWHPGLDELPALRRMREFLASLIAEKKHDGD